MTDVNLAYLEKEWLRNKRAECALKNFQRWPDKKLKRVLRHHDETPNGIGDRETWWRDEFDYLLGFYGIVEIAAMIGFVREFSWP